MSRAATVAAVRRWWWLVPVVIVAACSSGPTDSSGVGNETPSPAGNPANASAPDTDPVGANAPVETDVSDTGVFDPTQSGAAGGADPDEGAGVSAGACRWTTGEVRGTLPTALTELSGWALSKRHPNVLWGHNDAGEGARLIGVSTLDGSQVADLTISGATDVDWEDVATYTAPDGTAWIVVADTGDNAERRDRASLVLVAEPELSATTTAAAGTVEVAWAGGAHDVEALIVDPFTGDAILIGKRFDGVPAVSIDRIPAAALVARVAGGAGEPPAASTGEAVAVVAEHIGTFPVPSGERFGPTAASIDAAGTTIGLLFYGDRAMIWRRDPAHTVVDTIVATEPCVVETGSGKFESLAIADDGTLFVATEGRGVPLVAYRAT